MTRPKRAPALPGLDEKVDSLGGPVYQGVCATIRALFPKPKGHRATCVCEVCTDTKERKERAAGTLAQARSVAGSIDRCSGHAGTPQASGMQLAALHAQLDQLLARLDPDANAGDEFDDFTRDLADTREEMLRAYRESRATEAPHGQE